MNYIGLTYPQEEIFSSKVIEDDAGGGTIKGDVVLCHKQSEVESGELAILALKNNDTAIMRRATKTKDGYIFTADGNGRNVPPILSKDCEYKIIGKVFRIIRDI